MPMETPEIASLNNAPLLCVLGRRLDSDQNLPVPTPRRRLLSDPVLPSNLPPSGFIQREADDDAPKAMARQLQQTPPPSPTVESLLDHKRERRSSSHSDSPTVSSKSPLAIFRRNSKSTAWKDPEPFEVLAAVERKDVIFLMEIRDRAFYLLLRKIGDVTPLIHAMRCGPSHKEVSIILLGAFSRWVNHLEDEDMKLPQTKSLLRSLRLNLKFAIDFGLSKSQSDLIASFLQTLIMSEGDAWVMGKAADISYALHVGTAGKPVQTAQAAVRHFATKELGRAELIASLEDYISNATVDLLMIGAWSAVLDKVHGEQIPSYYFARDDRVYKAFCDRLDDHKTIIEATTTRRLRWQLRTLRKVLEGRSISYRHKVELLAAELDEGRGV